MLVIVKMRSYWKFGMSKLVLLGSKYLHGLIYFVADAPAPDNISPLVPLVGTGSYKNLLKWIGDMDIDITRVRMYNQSDDPFGNTISRLTLNKAVELDQIKVIALGQKASNYLSNVGVDEYFVLPHPSPKNRLLNDKEYVSIKLSNCKKYIYEGVTNGDAWTKKNIEEDLREEQELPSDPSAG